VQTLRYVINVGYAIIGEDLSLHEDISIEIENGVIIDIRHGFRRDCENVFTFPEGIAVPLLTNAHVHSADYVLPEVGSDLYIDDLVGEPYGVKYFILKKHHMHLQEAIKSFLKSALLSGTYMVIDFREGGIEGLNIAIEACKGTLTKYVPLGMLTKRTPQELQQELNEILKLAKGVALSSPLYYNTELLRVIAFKVMNCKGKIISAHISETEETRRERDFEYLLNHIRPHQIVHGTYLSETEFQLLKDLNIYLVICPRANLWFIGKYPPIDKIYKVGVKVAIGTDNSGWIKPSIWRDLEVIASIMRTKLGFIDPDWILKAAILGGPESIGFKPPIINEGHKAYLMVLSGPLFPIRSAHDKKLALIKRGGPESIALIAMENNIITPHE